MMLLLKGKPSKEVDKASKEASMAFKKVGRASEEARRGGGVGKWKRGGKGRRRS